ncbi:MAG: hypothetical protein LBN95_13650 [Prevotellaceae bacterium]|jgi:hypothetical protein|nr:hypothetical protein [Prevotellaceae bacterium]
MIIEPQKTYIWRLFEFEKPKNNTLILVKYMTKLNGRIFYAYQTGYFINDNFTNNYLKKTVLKDYIIDCWAYL